MKNKKITKCLWRVGGAILWIGSLSASDKLPTSDCQNRNNLILLHKCNPYQNPLLKVSSSDIIKTPSISKIPPKNLPKDVPFSFKGGITLDKLVEKYINYKEEMLERKELSKFSKEEKKLSSTSSSKVISTPKEENLSVKSPTPVNAPICEAKRVSIVRYKIPNQCYIPSVYIENEEYITPIEAVNYPKRLIYRVAKGDSLISLAKRFDTTVDSIVRLNNLSLNYNLKIGESILIIPGDKSKIKKRVQIEVPKGQYIVKRGDTLSQIAKKFNISIKDIKRLNTLKKDSHIRVGQILTLPLSQIGINRVLNVEKKKKLEALRKKARLLKKKRLKERAYHLKYSNSKKYRHKLRVTATAYTSHKNQTDSTPFLAAWNNRLHPGMKIIAVSPDLIRKYRLTNGVRVKISGLKGYYIVRDKMNPRLHNHIDIYMGLNRRRALRWGRRRVNIYW